MALLTVACLVALSSLASNAFAARQPVDLGTADTFGVLAGSTVTNTGPSRVNGDLGVSPGTAVTGFPPGTVNGTIHAADAVAARAQVDARTAYNDAAGRAPAVAVLADLGGRTLTPGVYKSGAALGLTGTLTLDARGDPDAVFVFQAGSTLTTAPGSRVNLINGAQPCNVSWQIGSSATLGTASAFSGNILASESVSMNDAVTLNGRALARNGAVTLINDTITAARCAPGTNGVDRRRPARPLDRRRPARPLLRSPRAGARVRAGIVRFSWHPAARAARYTLMVDDRRMNTGSRTGAAMRVRAGSHSYRVIARNGFGARSSRARAFSASANGCSFAPDRPAGYNFKPACNRHDDCYANFHSYSKRWKTRCDSRFKKNMNRVCSRQDAARDRAKCSGIASEYHLAVKWFGGHAYREAQKKASQGNSGDIDSHQAGRRRRARG